MATQLKNLSDFSHTTVPDGSTFKFAIAVAEWNAEITGSLYKGALETLLKHGVPAENIISVPVPGSFELTAAAEILLQKHKDLDAVICLGCVIQGETKHFDFICDAVANGITDVGIKHSKPVIFGVLTTNDQQQAIDRAGGKHGNKGDEAAITALKMAELLATV
ncbi:6,7-dimethyl-8-ribityllumazine synthase [Pedobacter heparinus]|uniref:6,7-dimethyl-8-ribityllumazine synthase n=1 Tax=Pedobacter heparinus (strain ATCC 13125 / DSM 2366 / CIP 104194 / JCM 7457 / NBRC 12017 / NCIMB 9290 / NRRL B-14731 / HIM 762-3) TaxID=485917 RepID=C6Y0J0_PEDHD|nr:6,7-dimethyl-8-ribityllumazine synthase [Pedobacter heparinus]ACU02751.1 6,7-dimethyl-8-ribityllumazine synthase [Pedobacter heparinus DSM 2366]